MLAACPAGLALGLLWLAVWVVAGRCGAWGFCVRGAGPGVWFVQGGVAPCVVLGFGLGWAVRWGWVPGASLGGVPALWLLRLFLPLCGGGGGPRLRVGVGVGSAGGVASAVVRTGYPKGVCCCCCCGGRAARS